MFRSLLKLNQGQLPDTLFALDYVLTEDDFFIYYTWTDETGWIGYSDFLEQAEDIKSKLTIHVASL